MAIGPIELQGTIARTQDIYTIKQNEDQKVTVDQNNFQNQFSKEVNDRPHQVNQSENADFLNRKFDAREKGSNQYSGDGGKNKKHKKEEDGRVLVKGQNRFDVKI